MLRRNHGFLTMEEAKNQNPLTVEYIQAKENDWGIIREMKKLRGIQIQSYNMDKLPDWLPELEFLQSIDVDKQSYSYHLSVLRLYQQILCLQEYLLLQKINL